MKYALMYCMAPNFVVEIFCKFHNYTVIKKILFTKFLFQLIIVDAINAG